MATINQNGHVQARCPTCSGALTSFQIGDPQRGHYGQLFRHLEGGGVETYRLACCSGCGAGALITLLNDGRHTTLEDFYPEAEERHTLPASVPDGIVNEFREGEECAEAGCYRAAYFVKYHMEIDAVNAERFGVFLKTPAQSACWVRSRPETSRSQGSRED